MCNIFMQFLCSKIQLCKIILEHINIVANLLSKLDFQKIFNVFLKKASEI